MAFLYHKFTRQFLLTVILVWGAVSFWLLDPTPFARALIAILSVVSLYLIWIEFSPLFLLIFLSFTSSYALHGYLLSYNLPVWLIMLGIMVIFGYIFTFVEQKTGILGNRRLIYLFLFSLIVLEIFLALSYFLINPLGLSLIVAAICYLFVGFCYAVLAKRPEERLSTYLWIAVPAIAIILMTSSWSA